jgi:hypothetical protein
VVRNHVGEPVIRFPPCGAAGSARDSGSRGRRFDPCRGDQTSALGCGRSSTAEPWAVNPLVPVRLRPVTPKRISSHRRRELERQRTGLLPRMVRVRAPGDAPTPPVAESVRRTGLRNRRREACPFDSDRGDQLTVR